MHFVWGLNFKQKKSRLFYHPRNGLNALVTLFDLTRQGHLHQKNENG